MERRGGTIMERQWKLNEDMHKSDCVFDPITFEDIILAVHHNAQTPNAKSVEEAVKDILEIRMQDFEYIVANNINEIIAEAKKGRN
jgi:hypothetical protein